MDIERDHWPSVEDADDAPDACPYCEARDGEDHQDYCPLVIEAGHRTKREWWQELRTRVRAGTARAWLDTQRNIHAYRDFVREADALIAGWSKEVA